MWHIVTSEPLWATPRLPAEAQCVAIHPNGTEFAVGLWRRGGADDDGNLVYRFDSTTGAKINPPLDFSHYDRIRWVDMVAFDPADPLFMVLLVRN